MSPSFILPFPGGSAHAPGRAQLLSLRQQLSAVSRSAFPSLRVPAQSPPVLPRSGLEPAAARCPPARTEPRSRAEGLRPLLGAGWGGGMATALAPETIGSACHLGQGSSTTDRRMARGGENAPDWGEPLQTGVTPPTPQATPSPNSDAFEDTGAQTSNIFPPTHMLGCSLIPPRPPNPLKCAAQARRVGRVLLRGPRFPVPPPHQGLVPVPQWGTLPWPCPQFGAPHCERSRAGGRGGEWGPQMQTPRHPQAHVTRILGRSQTLCTQRTPGRMGPPHPEATHPLECVSPRPPSRRSLTVSWRVPMARPRSRLGCGTPLRAPPRDRDRCRGRPPPP